MATLTNLNPTLLDLANALDPNGRVSACVELMNQVNEVLMHWSFQEGNLTTGNRTTVRTGIPTPTWRRLYKGIPDGKSSRATITDTVGMLEAYNEIDKELADLGGNAGEFRASEARATLEGMAQMAATTLFYGNTVTDPDRFDGLAPRFNLKSGAGNSENVIDGGAAGGQTDCASIWLLVWSPDTLFGIIPKGSQAGLQMTDLGQQTLLDSSGLKYQGYRTHFQWKMGLCLKDWRYVVRIANIDRSLLTRDAATGPNLPDLMFEALERLPSMPAGARIGFYMDRNLRTKLRQQLAALTKNSTLEYSNVGGHRVATWNEVNIYRCDALAVNETAIS